MQQKFSKTMLRWHIRKVQAAKKRHKAIVKKHAEVNTIDKEWEKSAGSCTPAKSSSE